MKVFKLDSNYSFYVNNKKKPESLGSIVTVKKLGYKDWEESFLLKHSNDSELEKNLKLAYKEFYKIS